MEPMVFFFTWFLCTKMVITNLDIDDKLMVIDNHIKSKARYQILHHFYQLKCFFISYINQRISLQHEIYIFIYEVKYILFW